MKKNNLKNFQVEDIKNILEEILIEEKFDFKSDNPFSDVFDFYYSFKIMSGLSIIIAKQNSFNQRLDVVSSVNFSPEHVLPLSEGDEKLKNDLANDLIFWLTPREPDYQLIFEPQNIKNLVPNEKEIPPFYVVRMSVYFEELSISSLMRAINLVSKSSLIARRLIQIRLNPLMSKMKEEKI